MENSVFNIDSFFEDMSDEDLSDEDLFNEDSFFDESSVEELFFEELSDEEEPESDNYEEDLHILRNMVFEEGLINIEHSLIYKTSEKEYNILLQLISAAGSNYLDEDLRSEFDYYLENLRKSDISRKIIEEVDNPDTLLSFASEYLLWNHPKSDAILFFLLDEDIVPISRNTIIFIDNRAPCIVYKLMQKGCYIHCRLRNGCSLAHAVVEGEQTEMVKYLLERNVNFDVVTDYFSTPINIACSSGNLEIIKLILDNNVVDLSIASIYHNRKTPIDKAILSNRNDILSVLLNSKSFDNLTADMLFQSFRNFCKTDFEAVKFESFKLLWPKLVDKDIMSRMETKELSILKDYLRHRGFASKYWIDGLKIMLTSDIASKILHEYFVRENMSIFSTLIKKFKKSNIERDNRINILNAFLSLNIKPIYDDITETVFHYNCHEEFELLRLSAVSNCTSNEETTKHYVGKLFCGMDFMVDNKKIFSKRLDRKFKKFLEQYFTPTTFANCLEEIFTERRTHQVMSLQEISRNGCRKFIKDNVKIESSKQFFDAVNNLYLPIQAKNYILLKVPHI